MSGVEQQQASQPTMSRLETTVKAKDLVRLFRADSHHSKPEVMDWLEEENVE